MPRNPSHKTLSMRERLILDPEDEKWRVRSWSGPRGYPVCRPRVGGKQKLLHRHLIGAKPGEIVDHMNGNHLDARKANLRVTSARLNVFNQKGDMRGVQQRGSSYYATAGRTHIGSFASAEAAYVARLIWELVHLGGIPRRFRDYEDRGLLDVPLEELEQQLRRFRRRYHRRKRKPLAHNQLGSLSRC